MGVCMSGNIIWQRFQQVVITLGEIKENTIKDLTTESVQPLKCGIVFNDQKFFFCGIMIEEDEFNIVELNPGSTVTDNMRRRNPHTIIQSVKYDDPQSAEILVNTLQRLRTEYLIANPHLIVGKNTQWQSIATRIDRILAQLDEHT